MGPFSGDSHLHIQNIQTSGDSSTPFKPIYKHFKAVFLKDVYRMTMKCLLKIQSPSQNILTMSGAQAQ